MKRRSIIYTIALIILLVSAPCTWAADYVKSGQPCVPDRPVPPESVGGIGIPFDLPIWPTIIKTEFHILPWVSFGKANICLPGCSKPISIPAPCLSMKPIPVWFPWLRPLDIECNSPAKPNCAMP